MSKQILMSCQLHRVASGRINAVICQHAFKCQGMDRPGVRQVQEGSAEHGKIEKTGCKIICGAPTTLAVMGLMIMMMMMMMSKHNSSNHMLLFLFDFLLLLLFGYFCCCCCCCCFLSFRSDSLIHIVRFGVGEGDEIE